MTSTVESARQMYMAWQRSLGLDGLGGVWSPTSQNTNSAVGEAAPPPGGGYASSPWEFFQQELPPWHVAAAAGCVPRAGWPPEKAACSPSQFSASAPPFEPGASAPPPEPQRHVAAPHAGLPHPSMMPTAGRAGDPSSALSFSSPGDIFIFLYKQIAQTYLMHHQQPPPDMCHQLRLLSHQDDLLLDCIMTLMAKRVAGVGLGRHAAKPAAQALGEPALSPDFWAMQQGSKQTLEAASLQAPPAGLWAEASVNQVAAWLSRMHQMVEPPTASAHEPSQEEHALAASTLQFAVDAHAVGGPPGVHLPAAPWLPKVTDWERASGAPTPQSSESAPALSWATAKAREALQQLEAVEEEEQADAAPTGTAAAAAVAADEPRPVKEAAVPAVASPEVSELAKQMDSAVHNFLYGDMDEESQSEDDEEEEDYLLTPRGTKVWLNGKPLDSTSPATGPPSAWAAAPPLGATSVAVSAAQAAPVVHGCASAPSPCGQVLPVQCAAASTVDGKQFAPPPGLELAPLPATALRAATLPQSGSGDRSDAGPQDPVDPEKMLHFILDRVKGSCSQEEQRELQQGLRWLMSRQDVLMESALTLLSQRGYLPPTGLESAEQRPRSPPERSVVGNQKEPTKLSPAAAWLNGNFDGREPAEKVVSASVVASARTLAAVHSAGSSKTRVGDACETAALRNAKVQKLLEAKSIQDCTISSPSECSTQLVGTPPDKADSEDADDEENYLLTPRGTKVWLTRRRHATEPVLSPPSCATITPSPSHQQGGSPMSQGAPLTSACMGRPLVPHQPSPMSSGPPAVAGLRAPAAPPTRNVPLPAAKPSASEDDVAAQKLCDSEGMFHFLFEKLKGSHPPQLHQDLRQDLRSMLCREDIVLESAIRLLVLRGRLGPAGDAAQPPQGAETSPHPCPEQRADEPQGAPDLPPLAGLSSEGDSNEVTLMIRNLPPTVTQNVLAEALAKEGYAEHCDLVYLPSMFGTSRGRGYAFMNFTKRDKADEFKRSWEGSRRLGLDKEEFKHYKPLAISVAHLQGREMYLRQWESARRRRVRNPAHRPLV